MAASGEIDNTNEETIYTFRFGTTKKVIHLTGKQVNCIPYLSLLVTHNNDFSSIENEDGEYVLDSQIRYNWFTPIFQSATTGHPSALFTELPQDAYVWGMLQLYDYLCVNPIPVPLLKDQNLVRTNFDNIDKKKFRIEYSRANNRLEVRDIAAQFIVALSKNEYNFNDFDTLQSIYSLTMIILSNPNIFGVRLCHHMLTVTKKLCFSSFSFTQQCKWQNAERSIQNIKNHSLIYLSDGHQTLPKHFKNAFAWKGIHVPIKEDNSADRQSACNQKSTNSEIRFDYNFWNDIYLPSEDFYFHFPSIEFNLNRLITPPPYDSNEMFDNSERVSY
jgi:hypothetical protein